MSFEQVLRAFALGSLLALWPAAASAAASHCPKPISSASSVARLDRLENSKLEGGPGVRVTREDKRVLAESCMPLRRGDIVETGPSVPVLIEFAEGLVLLMPNTKVRIGSIWTFFGELFSFGHVKLQDRYVTAGAEGTSYIFRSDANGTTVTVLQGHVRVTPEKEARLAQRFEAGQRVRLAQNAAPIVTRLTAAEVSQELQTYQVLTGYTAAELSLKERMFAQSAEGPGSTSVPAEGSAPSGGDIPIDTGPAQPPDAATASVAGASPSAGSAAAIASGRSRNTASVLVQGSFSFGSDDAPIEIGSGSLSFAWSRRIVPLGTLQFGSRLSGGATFGRYRSPMFDPHAEEVREEAASAGTARLPFQGAFAKLDAELGGSAGVWNLVGSLGLRGGWSHLPDVPSKANQFVWGPAASARAEYPLAPGVHGLFELEFWFQKTPVAACSIGCNDPAVPRDAVWQAWLGFAIGMGFDL
jgi:hypothetical protein